MDGGPNMEADVPNMAADVPNMAAVVPNMAVAVPNMAAAVPNMAAAVPNMAGSSRVPFGEACASHDGQVHGERYEIVSAHDAGRPAHRLNVRQL